MIQLKEHLTMDGLEKIVAIKASINRGLSDELKAAFPGPPQNFLGYVIPVKRPIVTLPVGCEVKKIFDPNWLAGFTSAEGCFQPPSRGSKCISFVCS